MAVLQVDLDPTPRTLRHFAGLALPAFGALLGAAVLHLASSLPAALAVWAGTAALALLGLRRPRFARVLYVGLARLTLPIGLVLSSLMLAVIYFGVATPLAFALRRLRSDPLTRHIDRATDSYWMQYDAPEEPKRYFQQF